jgi:hypothetical protein
MHAINAYAFWLITSSTDHPQARTRRAKGPHCTLALSPTRKQTYESIHLTSLDVIYAIRSILQSVENDLYRRGTFVPEDESRDYEAVDLFLEK